MVNQSINQSINQSEIIDRVFANAQTDVFTSAK